MVRAYQADDAQRVAELLTSAWPEDPVLQEISAIHGADLDVEDRWRRTLVFVTDEQVVGCGTLLRSSRHPSRYFTVVLVSPSARRRGIGSQLLIKLVELGDGRPLLARVREKVTVGRAFLQAHAFGVLMRNRVGVVDPNRPPVQAWVAALPSISVESGVARDELALAHEVAYAAEHASWAPATQRPLAAVAGLHGPPLAPSRAELFLIAGSPTRDADALRAVVAAELDLARSLCASVSIEADDANEELSRILDELPARMEPTLLLMSTDEVTAVEGRFAEVG